MLRVCKNLEYYYEAGDVSWTEFYLFPPNMVKLFIACKIHQSTGIAAGEECVLSDCRPPFTHFPFAPISILRQVLLNRYASSRQKKGCNFRMHIYTNFRSP